MSEAMLVTKSMDEKLAKLACLSAVLNKKKK
jgi:hypothetical protein